MLGTTVDSLILRALSRDPSTGDYAGGTVKTNEDNALDFVLKTVPGFLKLVQGKRVLDYGCGWGWQALATAKHGASEVTGYDIDSQWVRKAREKIVPGLNFTTSLEGLEPFDAVYSCSAFEHYADPAKEMATMKSLTVPGGCVVITFAEPWLSPRGAHVDNFTRVPWTNVLFGEEAVMKVRSLYRDDGARRYEDVRGGLNRMTLAKFEQIIRDSGLKVEFYRNYPVKNLPLVERVPLIREFMSSAAAVILRN